MYFFGSNLIYEHERITEIKINNNDDDNNNNNIIIIIFILKEISLDIKR